MSGPYCFLIESHDNGHIGWINIDKKYPNTKERKKKSKSWHYIVYGYWFTLCLFDKVLGSWFLIKIKEGYTWFQRIEYGVPRWQVWKRVVQICLSRFPLVINTGIHKSCIIVWCCCYGLTLYSEYHIALYGS